MDFYSRDLKDTDINDINELHSLPEVTQYQIWDVQSYEDTELFIKRVLDKDSHWIYNVIVNPDTDKVIGTFQLLIDESNNSAEIGYIVHPKFWNHGIATDMVATIVKYGFKVLKLNRIWGAMDSKNIAARIVLQKAGMEHEAVLRQDTLLKDGSYRDTLIFGILKSEY